MKKNQELNQLNNLIFDNKLIKFLSNTNEMNKFEIGIIDFEQLGETTVFLFNFQLFYYILSLANFFQVFFRLYSIRF